MHKMVWKRRVAIARRPGLVHHQWRYRAALGSKPALRKHAHFLARHPRIGKGVVHHHRWVKKHHPPRAGKIPKVVKPAKVKVKGKPGPAPKKQRKQKQKR